MARRAQKFTRSLIALEARPLLAHDAVGAGYPAGVGGEMIGFDGQDHRTGGGCELTALAFLQQNADAGGRIQQQAIAESCFRTAVHDQE